MGFKLFHIYGPISIHSYGLMIALGVIIFTWLIKKNIRYKKLGLQNTFLDILMIGIFAAFIGGRILSAYTDWDEFTHWYELFMPWVGGFSILGSILGIMVILPWYLKKKNIPIIPFFDLVAIYAPILQSISRIGCFFAGCCYGTATEFPWGIVYKYSNTVAPMNISVHPTQIYSSILLLLIFVLMYFVLQFKLQKTGQLFSAYLILASLERFTVDFWRAERTFISTPIGTLSINQVVALGIIIFGIASFIFSSQKKEY